MRIQRLTIEHVRLLNQVDIQPAAGINVLSGSNGAGKTSVLEAIHVLSCGRSFRSGNRDVLIQRGKKAFHVFAELQQDNHARCTQLGLSREVSGWMAKMNGETLGQLSQLFQALPVVCFEPGSHSLISGGAENRRRFMDWSLFHVEHDFLDTWRRYQRALKQRNTLLKQNAPELLAAWEQELSLYGMSLHRLRQAWVCRFETVMNEVCAELFPEVGRASVRYLPGWNADDGEDSLLSSLYRQRQRDLLLGHTQSGPHRAEWMLSFEHLGSRELFSRGQEKVAVLACLLAQMQCFQCDRQQWPILLLDDIASELDARHQARVLHWISDKPVQVFVTGVFPLQLPESALTESQMFHVEQGVITALV